MHEEQHATSGLETQVSREDDTNTSSASDDKARRKRGGSTRHQLIVHKVHPDGTVECQLLCKQKTISFKFNRSDTTPQDIIEGMIKQELLKPGPHTTLEEHLKEIIGQLNANPDKIPEVTQPYVQKVRSAIVNGEGKRVQNLIKG